MKIIDDDAFPTNKFAEEVDGGIPECVAEINPWLLMIELAEAGSIPTMAEMVMRAGRRNLFKGILLLCLGGRSDLHISNIIPIG